MPDIFDMTDTWNSGGTTFASIKMNVTDTASAAASLLMDLEVGGAMRFAVPKGGGWLARNSTTATDWFGTPLTTAGAFAFGYSGGANQVFGMNWDSEFVLPSGVVLAWTNGSTTTSTRDLFLLRDAANILAQRNGANAQTSRLYGTFTDSSNYRRVALTMSTAGVAELKPEGAGTGASGNVLHISGLPTSNPGPGILWNNAGTPAIGT